jgi:hypothetical protein
VYDGESERLLRPVLPPTKALAAGAASEAAASYGTTYWKDNVFVKLENRALTVTVEDKWVMKAVEAPFPFGLLNKQKSLLDVSVKALYDADHDVVAPHGIFGQSYDGDDIAVDGKLDKRDGDESTTEAQAEGALEGVIADYRIAANDPYSPAFKYSRYDLTKAMPRDVSKLTGHKHKREEQAGSTAGAVTILGA